MTDVDWKATAAAQTAAARYAQQLTAEQTGQPVYDYTTGGVTQPSAAAAAYQDYSQYQYSPGGMIGGGGGGGGYYQPTPEEPQLDLPQIAPGTPGEIPAEEESTLMKIVKSPWTWAAVAVVGYLVLSGDEEEEL